MSRSALGSLTNGQLNSRTSLGGPARNPVAAKPGAHRMTLGPSTASSRRKSSIGDRRKSSIGGSSIPGPGGASSAAAQRAKLHDPRHPSDKATMNRSIRGLIAYLGEHGYDHPICPKTLTAPSVRDFRNMLEFLVSRIDPHFELKGKLEDEVPGVLRRLRYPFNVSKSALKSVGSPHAWPTLLAALSWLVELLRYQEAVEEIEAQEIEGAGAGGAGAAQDGFFDPSGGAGAGASAGIQGAAGERLFFEYTSQAYVQFLSGRDDFDELDAGLIETFESRNRAVEAECDDTEARNAALREEIEALRGSKTPLQVVTEANADLAGDIDKFRKLIANRESHKATLERKIAEREEAAAKDREELAEACAERDTLQATFDAQDYSPEDVARMTKDRTILEETVASLETQRKDAEKIVWELDADIARRAEEVSRVVHRYNTQASMLQIVPRSAKHAAGADLELAVDPSASSASAIASVDVRNVARPAVDALREHYERKHAEARSALIAAEARAESALERTNEREAEVNAAQERVQKAEDALAKAKLAADESLAAIAQETEEIEAEMETRRGQDRASVETARAELLEATAEYERAQEKFSSEREKLSDAVLNTLDVLTTHKAYVSESLATANQATSEILNEIIAL